MKRRLKNSMAETALELARLARIIVGSHDYWELRIERKLRSGVGRLPNEIEWSVYTRPSGPSEEVHPWDCIVRSAPSFTDALERADRWLLDRAIEAHREPE